MLTQLQIINSLAKGRPADAALLAAGIRPPRPTGPEEPLHPSAEPQLNTASVGAVEGGSLLQAHKAAFFFKLERELEKVSLLSPSTELMRCRSTRSTTSENRR